MTALTENELDHLYASKPQEKPSNFSDIFSITKPTLTNIESGLKTIRNQAAGVLTGVSDVGGNITNELGQLLGAPPHSIHTEIPGVDYSNPEVSAPREAANVGTQAALFALPGSGEAGLAGMLDRAIQSGVTGFLTTPGSQLKRSESALLSSLLPAAAEAGGAILPKLIPAAKNTKTYQKLLLTNPQTSQAATDIKSRYGASLDDMTKALEGEAQSAIMDTSPLEQAKTHILEGYYGPSGESAAHNPSPFVKKLLNKANNPNTFNDLVGRFQMVNKELTPLESKINPTLSQQRQIRDLDTYKGYLTKVLEDYSSKVSSSSNNPQLSNLSDQFAQMISAELRPELCRYLMHYAPYAAGAVLGLHHPVALGAGLVGGSLLRQLAKRTASRELDKLSSDEISDLVSRIKHGSNRYSGSAAIRPLPKTSNTIKVLSNLLVNQKGNQ